MRNSYENLKIIWFENEMLPKWAQLLGTAARLCPVPEATRQWFSQLTNSSGVDDARTVIAEVKILQLSLREHKETIITQLQRTRGDSQAARIFAGWEYSLETIIQGAASKKTCSWKIENCEDTGEGDYGDGDINLRRV
jgi:hypothetical protein